MKQMSYGTTKIVKTICCPKCKKPYGKAVLGMLRCENCGHEEPDDFGRVRTYIEEHGPSTALEIARDVGISINKVNSFLRSGKLEIPEGSLIYIQCQKCGTDIRFGRYCPNCAREIAQELKDAFDISDIGEVPKGMSGKMHSNFLDHKR